MGWPQQGWMQVGSLSAIFPPSGWEGARATSQAGSWVGAIWAFSSSSSQENGDHTVRRGFPGGSVLKNQPANAGDTGSIPGWGEIPLEKEMATHSSFLDWEIPWTEATGGLQSMGSQESDMT